MGENGPLWEALNDIRERITRMESCLESFSGQVSERCSVRADRLKSVENRLSDLERRVWFMIGASAAVSSVATVIVSVVIKKIMGM
jgi:tetrahydromethanopterin S-methyltransferase subunit G